VRQRATHAEPDQASNYAAEVPEHHLGRRRRQARLPVGRLLVLAVAVAAIIRVLTLADPASGPGPVAEPFGTIAPNWSGPTPVDVPGVLVDGAAYTPRVFLTSEISAGVATSADGTVRVVLDTPAGQATELRRLAPTDQAQINGFAFTTDTLVWMESVSRAGSGVVTSMWRTTWRNPTRPVQVTTNTGDASFFGLQSDVVMQDGRAYWIAIGAGQETVTEVRSVPVAGGAVTTKRLTGEYVLSTWPYAVSVTGGRGAPVTLLDLTTDATTTVDTRTDDVPVCNPTWCRVALAGGNGLTGIEMVHPDGSQRRRIAGPEATPTIADATLLDRYVPLATDRGAGGTGLSLFDLASGRTDLVTPTAANVQGRDGVLWWSTGAGTSLVWHAVDLRGLG
jgi:hypothetical protein